MESIADRLKWARRTKTQYKTATEAARAFGWPVSTYLGHENGDRSPSRDTAKKYARAYKVRWEWLLEGDGAPDAHGGARTAMIGGYAGAGAEIHPLSEDELGDHVDLPPGAPIGTVGIIVRGDSMYPRYFDGERLFYLPDHLPPTDAIGRECVVKLRDGRMLVKIVRRGSKRHLFNLDSWNAPTLEDQKLEWASPVRWRG
jgi:phage repressor protein C with HTH and peptisase S24 domain